MKSHNTAVGPDEIHYEFLKQLPSCSLDFLLQAFNEVWVSGKFPSWKQATIIPIPKPGKDNTDPSNYRPIALTSCLCKTLERMINTRLIWFLESNGLITNFQCGFRSKRSTVDHLVRLETFVREAFIKKEHLTAVFFDLEKAYDTTWKYGIMRDLSDFGLKDRLPHFIDNFLSNRNFKVRVGTTLSDLQGQEEGVPQGSILSVTLFSIKINIFKLLTQVLIAHYMLMIFLSVINLNICIQSSVNFSNVLRKFRSGPWRTVLNSPRPKHNVCIFVNFGASTMIQFLSWID